MSGEKTEEPTPHRLEQLRKKGDVARSSDLASAGVFVAMLALIAALPSSLAADFSQVWSLCLGSLDAVGRGATDVQLVELLAAALGVLLLALLVPLGVLMLAAGLSTALQIGPLLTLAPLIPKLERLSPAKNFQNMFSPHGLTEVLRALIKIGLGVAAVIMIILADYQLLLRLAISDLRGAALVGGTLVWDLAVALVLVAVMFGAVDVFYQWLAWLKRNRMSKDEVKREHENMEGKPEVKQARREAYEQMTTAKMCSKVREEGMVLVRNPTHVAVVLKYTKGGVPVVVARGTGAVARRIIAEARKLDLPEQHDRKLARALLKVKPSHGVPKPLWEAVSELLNWASLEYQRTNRLAPWDQPPERGS